MRFDLENLNPGTTFTEKDGSWLTIKILSIDEIDEIRKASVRKSIDYHDNQRFKYEDIDEKKFSEMTWEKSIVDWGKQYTADDVELKCTKENKIMLMRQSPSFAKYYMDCFKKLNAAVEAEKEAEEKN